MECALCFKNCGNVTVESQIWDKAYACGNCTHFYMTFAKEIPGTECICQVGQMAECLRCRFDHYGYFGLENLSGM